MSKTLKLHIYKKNGTGFYGVKVIQQSSRGSYFGKHQPGMPPHRFRSKNGFVLVSDGCPQACVDTAQMYVRGSHKGLDSLVVFVKANQAGMRWMNDLRVAVAEYNNHQIIRKPNREGKYIIEEVV